MISVAGFGSARWRKSRHSGGDNACVEVAAHAGMIAVRDSKDPGGPRLILGRAGWRAFLRSAKRGHFDIA